MPVEGNDVLIGALSATGAAMLAWKTLFPWIGDDLKTLNGFAKIGTRQFKNIAANRMIIDAFEEHVENHPQKTLLYFEDREYSYEFVDAMANRVANLVLSWGLRSGDVVAAMLQNEPAFVWTFLGTK